MAAYSAQVEDAIDHSLHSTQGNADLSGQTWMRNRHQDVIILPWTNAALPAPSTP